MSRLPYQFEKATLYSVFGDKRTIFLRALRAYAEAKGARAVQALFSPPSLRDSLAGFLKHAVESAPPEGSYVRAAFVFITNYGYAKWRACWC